MQRDDGDDNYDGMDDVVDYLMKHSSNSSLQPKE